MSVFPGRRQRLENDSLAAPGAVERLARQEERLALLEQRIRDRDFLRAGFPNAAPDAEQYDRVAVIENQQDGMAKRGRHKSLPVELRRLGFETKLTGDLDQPA